MDNHIKNFTLATAFALAVLGFSNTAQAVEADKADFSPVYFQPLHSGVSYATMRQPSVPTFNSHVPLPPAAREQQAIEFLAEPPVQIRRISNTAETNVNDDPLPPLWLVTVPLY